MLVPRLRALRIRQAMSQQELADRAGLARSTVIKAENGQELRLSSIKKLARVLGVRPDELMPADID